MSFFLFGDYDEKLRLKSFTGASRNGKMTIRVEIECPNTMEFGWALEKLEMVKTGQRTKPKPDPEPRKSKQLALPAPQRALPAPNDGGGND